MDKARNPFAPGAGSPPPELAGREDILEQAEVLLARVLAGRPAQSILMTGLRGVGKTVLLNQIERMAVSAGYHTIHLEASENKPLTAQLAPHLRTLIYELDRLAGAGQKVKRDLAVLKGFLNAIKVSVGDIELGLDIDPEVGVADSGILDVDLPNLFVAVAEAAQERQTAVALLIDEVQYARAAEMGALVMAMHKMQQRQLPLVLIGAGLPTLSKLLGDAKSYAERLFSYPIVGPLSQKDAERALSEPVEAEGVAFTPSALDDIYALTNGYPYFLQEWGYTTWNRALTSPIDSPVVQDATVVTTKRLDENFFRVRFDRCTPAEKKFLRAMAQLGRGPHRISDIAACLGLNAKSLGPTRAQLLAKGMVYAPSHGDLDFTVPLFDEFMRRAIPDFNPADDD